MEKRMSEGNNKNDLVRCALTGAVLLGVIGAVWYDVNTNMFDPGTTIDGVDVSRRRVY